MMNTLKLPNKAASKTIQTIRRNQLLPIISSHGLKASGIGEHLIVSCFLVKWPQILTKFLGTISESFFGKKTPSPPLFTSIGFPQMLPSLYSLFDLHQLRK